MRLHSLRLSNFRQHVDTRIDFDAGITWIMGPNGSGKSTIFEAIAWALYGTPAIRGKRESIRTDRLPASAPVNVDLDFELGRHRYFVSRGLTRAEVYLDGGASPVANSITGTTDFLRRRLGMSHQEFFNTYFTGQKDLSKMAGMAPAERAQFLSRVLGYERLRTAQMLARERRKVIVAEAGGLRGALPEPEAVARALEAAHVRVRTADAAANAAAARRTTAAQALEALSPRWDAMQRERDATRELLAEIRVAHGDRAAIEKDLSRITGELEELAASRDALAKLGAELAPLAGLQAELTELERSFNEDARRKTIVETEAELSRELVRLRERRVAIATAPVREAELAAALEIARSSLARTQEEFQSAQTEWVRDKQEAETKRQSLLVQLREVQQNRDQIVELGENGICPICARPLETHFRNVLDLFEGQIDSITSDGKYWRARIAQLKSTPAAVQALEQRGQVESEAVTDLVRQVAAVQAAAKELASVTRDLTAKETRHAEVSRELATIAVSYDAARHAVVRAKIDRLTPLVARVSKLTAQVEREGQLVSDRDRVRISSDQVGARIAELEARRAESPFSEEAFAVVRDDYERADAEARAADLAAVAADGERKSGRAALDAATKAQVELARGLEKLARLDYDRRVHDELDRAFGDLRTDLNQEMRPELSDRASQYIHDLTDGRYSGLDLDEQYNVTMLEDELPKPVISGGEEDLANLVLRLAISEMIAERAGQAFSLLILDEVFGSLDDTRRHNVVDLLRRLQDRFEQVILITHIESVKVDLDRVVKLRYDDESGTSRVETELMSEGPLLDIQAGAAD